ncbi:hypothetical protein DFS34DRAFT_651345 [Phlyctochytrium arcticum]|nr:hypothetical protein DFS34DRAFT_651345 [Phlyctochytrium arcticum]
MYGESYRSESSTRQPSAGSAATSSSQNSPIRDQYEVNPSREKQSRSRRHRLRPAEPDPEDLADAAEDFLMIVEPSVQRQEPYLRGYIEAMLSRFARWQNRGRATATCFEAACVGGARYLQEINVAASRSTTALDAALARALAGLVVDAVEPEMAFAWDGPVREKAVSIVTDEFLAKAAHDKISGPARRRAMKRKSGYDEQSGFGMDLPQSLTSNVRKLSLNSETEFPRRDDSRMHKERGNAEGLGPSYPPMANRDRSQRLGSHSRKSSYDELFQRNTGPRLLETRRPSLGVNPTEYRPGLGDSNTGKSAIDEKRAIPIRKSSRDESSFKNFSSARRGSREEHESDRLRTRAASSTAISPEIGSQSPISPRGSPIPNRVDSRYPVSSQPLGGLPQNSRYERGPSLNWKAPARRK